MCTVLLPPAGNTIAVNKYINLSNIMKKKIEYKWNKEWPNIQKNL